MDSPFEGLVLDPSKCRKLSMEEKRELIHEISKLSEAAPEILRSWSRRELLQILCAEMGKERKYTGLTKSKMIELLMRVVSEKKYVKRRDDFDLETKDSPSNTQTTYKRQRKSEHPTRLSIAANNSVRNSNGDLVKCCQNSACRATLHQEDAFCKRCTCCICYQYDDNKDPSLWLFCSSEPPYEGDSCGLSCHLECAMKHERTGITKDGHLRRLDGSFCCVFCGKMNDLLGSWRKQLIVAKDSRRVDVLCYRVYLSQKLLHGTEKYRKQNELVEIAAKMLEAEVGILADSSPKKMGRGIVNRLQSGPEVQKLCASAVEALDLKLACSVIQHLPIPKSQVADSRLTSPGIVRFENVSPTSINVVLGSEGTSKQENLGYTIWHRKADFMEYPSEPTCTLFMSNSKYMLSDLSPATQYCLRVIPFNAAKQLGSLEVKFKTNSCLDDGSKSLVAERNPSPTTNSSSLSNPSSEGNESNNITAFGDRDRDDSTPDKGIEEMPGDSVSALDEDRATGEVGSMNNSTNQTEFLRNSTNPTTYKQVPDIPQSENHSLKGQLIKEMETGNMSDSSERELMVTTPFGPSSNAIPPVTPFKPEIVKDMPGRSARAEPKGEKLHKEFGTPEKETQAGSTSKKASGARWDDECTRNGSPERYELCVKTVRRLECEGYIEKSFRIKFLTWYSLRASPQERRIVKVFVDTFIDDPVSLAGQLIDTFSEDISNPRPLGIPRAGFCMRLFH